MSAVDQLSHALASRSQAFVWIETLLLAAINTTAVLGNLLVCSSVYRNRRLRTIPNTFVVALAISDILTSCLSMPLSVEILARGRFTHGQAACSFQGFCVFTFAIISLETMGIIALNRYFRVCRPNQHLKLFKLRSTISCIALIWATALFATLPPFFLREAFYQFQPGKALCIIPFEDNIGYTAFVEVVYIATPLNVIIICYVLLFRSVRNTNRVFHSQQEGTRLHTNVEEAKVTKTLVAVFVGFAICWLPVTVIDYIDAAIGEPTLNRSVYLMYSFLVYISSALNPFIYGVMNRAFRREYGRIIFGLVRCGVGRAGESTD